MSDFKAASMLLSCQHNNSSSNARRSLLLISHKQHSRHFLVMASWCLAFYESTRRTAAMPTSRPKMAFLTLTSSYAVAKTETELWKETLLLWNCSMLMRSGVRSEKRKKRRNARILPTPAQVDRTTETTRGHTVTTPRMVTINQALAKAAFEDVEV